MIGGFIGKPIGGIVQTDGSISMPAAAGAYSISGQAALFSVNALHAAGSYAISGQDAVLDRSMPADVGTYSLSGQAALFSTNFLADVGAYALSGQAIAVGTNFPVEAGAYQITGNNDLGDITSAMLTLQLPIDCVLAGQQPYKESGREYEIRPRNIRTIANTPRSPVRALQGGKPSFTTRTSSRGYD